MRLVWLLLFPGLLCAQFDVLITGGKIVDGAGNPWFYGDVGIRGDTIAAIGKLSGATSQDTIDARGLIVAPGFIDIHSHGRRGIFEVPTAENYLREGVTTMIEGPDGNSPVPLAPFLAKIAQTPVSINVASFVGHGSIRSEVMGLVNRQATPEEIAKMKGLARTAMLDGAMGLSTGLFYVPGNFANTEEVIEIAKVVGAFGGIHQSHMRDEGDHILDSVRETIRIGEEGGLPTQVTHHKVIGRANWGQSVATLKLVEEARARGVDVTMDQYPYTASSTGIAALFPQWSQAGGQKALVERLDAAGSREKIRREMIANIRDGRGGGDPKNVVIANCAFDASLAGKSLADLTRARGVPVTIENAADTAMELQRKGPCSAVYHAISEEDVERIMRSPYTMVASDGEIPVFGRAAPHARSYGTFARVLGVYVRERHVLTLEDAVRRMSGMPAERLKIADRGILRPGMKADVVVFDAATVSDKSTFEKPHQYSVGFRDVLVNGKAAVKDGKVTSERPGRVIFGPGWKDR
ncbi:MAG: dihydroorotase [Bryobacterales bacterium]|nr:dihydroorotase [Bryobacterales bacterium]